jgi:hypothetical protein
VKVIAPGFCPDVRRIVMKRLGIVVSGGVIVATALVAQVGTAASPSGLTRGVLGPNYGGPATRAHTVGGPVSPDDGVTTRTRQLAFWGPREVRVFEVLASNGSRLVVDTRDCCVVGDRWGVTLVDPDGAPVAPPPPDPDLLPLSVPATSERQRVLSACGNGSGESYSGRIRYQSNGGRYTLRVYYCGGVDLFPAGLTLRLRYDGDLSVRRIAA